MWIIIGPLPVAPICLPNSTDTASSNSDIQSHQSFIIHFEGGGVTDLIDSNYSITASCT